MKRGIYLCLAVLLAAACASAQEPKKIEIPEEYTHFATRPCLPMYGKGGVGIVNEHLYVLTKTPHNELILKSANWTESRWKGKSATQRQVVFVFEGKVWTANALPRNFNLGESVIVSFEVDKIRLFDFQAEQGCYFLHGGN
jgi:hypothetical protein